MGAYGYNIEHILMVDIIPDPSVRRAMNEINAGDVLTNPCFLYCINNSFSVFFIAKCRIKLSYHCKMENFNKLCPVEE